MNDTTQLVSVVLVVVVSIVVLIWVIIPMIGRPSHASEKRNCERCGKPFEPKRWTYETLCHSCQKEFERAVEKEMQKMPQKVQCVKCDGSGKIKGYRCVECQGSGYILRGGCYMVADAVKILRLNSEWSKFSCFYKQRDD